MGQEFGPQGETLSKQSPEGSRYYEPTLPSGIEIWTALPPNPKIPSPGFYTRSAVQVRYDGLDRGLYLTPCTVRNGNGGIGLVRGQSVFVRQSDLQGLTRQRFGFFRSRQSQPVPVGEEEEHFEQGHFDGFARMGYWEGEDDH